MNIRNLTCLACVVPLLFACGSPDESNPSEEGMEPVEPGNEMGKKPVDEPDPSECDPNAEIPCVEGIAEPCENYDTGFRGDEFCRAEPDPALGMQLHVGPEDYDDPEQTEPYMLAPGAETNWYEPKVGKNTETVFTRGYRSYMRPGSHHFIMYGTNDAVTEGQGPQGGGEGIESAMGAVGGTFLGGATKPIQNIDTMGPNPEDQGIGSEIAPNRGIYVNLHFVNTTEDPILQEIWVNFIYIDEAEVTKYVKPVTWYGGLGMNIPPGEHVVLENAPGSCTAPDEFRIGMLTAHAHASTSRVTTLQNGELLFEDYDWAEPTEWRYRADVDNPTPDLDAGISGGASGLVYAKPGDDFIWQCEVQNKGTTNITFSNRVYDGEMCNVFGYYFTDNRNAGPWMCAFF